jgi:hypothetical protein
MLAPLSQCEPFLFMFSLLPFFNFFLGHFTLRDARCLCKAFLTAQLLISERVITVWIFIFHAKYTSDSERKRLV